MPTNFPVDTIAAPFSTTSAGKSYATARIGLLFPLPSCASVSSAAYLGCRISTERYAWARQEKQHI